jgi:hypothetical protein
LVALRADGSSRRKPVPCELSATIDSLDATAFLRCFLCSCMLAVSQPFTNMGSGANKGGHSPCEGGYTPSLEPAVIPRSNPGGSSSRHQTLKGSGRPPNQMQPNSATTSNCTPVLRGALTVALPLTPQCIKPSQSARAALLPRTGAMAVAITGFGNRTNLSKLDPGPPTSFLTLTPKTAKRDNSGHKPKAQMA